MLCFAGLFGCQCYSAVNVIRLSMLFVFICVITSSLYMLNHVSVIPSWVHLSTISSWVHLSIIPSWVLIDSFYLYINIATAMHDNHQIVRSYDDFGFNNATIPIPIKRFAPQTSTDKPAVWRHRRYIPYKGHEH